MRKKIILQNALSRNKIIAGRYTWRHIAGQFTAPAPEVIYILQTTICAFVLFLALSATLFALSES